MPKFALPHKRGTATIGTPKLVVLGGPTNLVGINWYTCLAVEEGTLDMSPRGSRILKTVPGENFMVPEQFISNWRAPLVWTEHAILHMQRTFAKGANYEYVDIPVQDCPQCDIEEMIFYSGDYICAWCREMLEA